MSLRAATVEYPFIQRRHLKLRQVVYAVFVYLFQDPAQTHRSHVFVIPEQRMDVVSFPDVQKYFAASRASVYEVA